MLIRKAGWVRLKANLSCLKSQIMKNQHQNEIINLKVMLKSRVQMELMIIKVSLNKNILWILNSLILIKVCFMKIKSALKLRVRLMDDKKLNFNQ